MAVTQTGVHWDSVAEQKKWLSAIERARKFQEQLDQHVPTPVSGFHLLCVAELDAGSSLASSACFASRETFFTELRRLIAEPTTPSRPVASIQAYRDAQKWWLESLITQYESNS
jgi:hypothetical protein